jgi:hypothetical protein
MPIDFPSRDVDILIYVVLWICIGYLIYRARMNNIATIALIHVTGFKKSAFLIQMATILLWPIGFMITFVAAYAFMKITQKRNKKE